MDWVWFKPIRDLRNIFISPLISEKSEITAKRFRASDQFLNIRIRLYSCITILILAMKIAGSSTEKLRVCNNNYISMVNVHSPTHSHTIWQYAKWLHTIRECDESCWVLIHCNCTQEKKLFARPSSTDTRNLSGWQWWNIEEFLPQQHSFGISIDTVFVCIRWKPSYSVHNLFMRAGFCGNILMEHAHRVGFTIWTWFIVKNWQTRWVLFCYSRRTMNYTHIPWYPVQPNTRVTYKLMITNGLVESNPCPYS